MRIADLLEETYTALSTNKARSALTILGIVIGIASVIAMTAIGQGAQASIESSITSAGANLLYVSPGQQRGVGVSVSAGRGSAQTLTQDDATAIQSSISLVKAVEPEVSRRYQITVKGGNTNTNVIGTTDAYPDVRNTQVAEGVFISSADLQNYNRVAVLGPTTVTDLFGEGSDPLGQKIRINNMEFTVVGVTAAKGGSGFQNPDDAVYVPLTTAQRYLSGDKYVSSIAVEAVDSESMTTVQQQITDLLLQRHNISDPTLADFSVINQADIVATASSVTGTFTILLASIAGISLLVGGVGIMNMMLTNVTERTREIGLRKAIGAEESDISMQFLLESVMLTFFGGAFGIILGWILAWGVQHFGFASTKVTLETVLLAFGVSAAIGIVFGYYPARRASKMNPIVALRFE
ncbi:MAG: ABC transporter permease [Patescibacteria group bacterium]|nr:ABC transporter permease [Patescibacteria group bacterium]